ncbi:MAG: PHP domain-containing protein, partial [bacterium]|nr:PHP domain-containing protein [bacterium]
DGETFIGRVEGSFPCVVRVASESTIGAALLWETGSQTHLEALGLKLKSHGYELASGRLWHEGRPFACESEEAIYQRAGCCYIPPELREGEREVELAAIGTLPELVVSSNLLGALHNHTTFSDGSGTLEEMGRRAGELGWSYLGIADHSHVAVYANGLDADRLREQVSAIDELNSKDGLPFLLKGLEADVLPDGALDLPDGSEAMLDYVVASVHSSFGLSEEKQTERILRAVRHPASKVLGHPTGRLLLARPGYAVNLEAVLQACAEEGVAAEINASPYRLDLDWKWARYALEAGARLIIDPDAHSPDGLRDLRWGLAVARKAGAKAADVLNTYELAGLGD